MDTHYCLNCHMTIDGLENYVAHRKEHCLRITHGTTKLAAATPTPPVEPAVTVASLPPAPLPVIHPTAAACSQSPTQLATIVNPTAADNATTVVPVTVPNEAADSAPPSTEDTSPILLYSPPPPVAAETTLENYDGAKGESNSGGDKGGGTAAGGIEDFLSTLELQVREKEKRIVGDDPQEGKIIDDKLKTLNILNDFDFSSDSDDLPSDLDELLDYANAEDDNPSTYRRVSRGGKWGPSGKGKGKHASGKSGKHAPRTYGGKGSKLRSHSRHSIGKSADMKDQNKADDSDDEAEEPPKVEKLECKTCARTFVGQYSYSRHLKSRFHKHKLNPKSKKKVKVKQEIECPICEKVFNTTYNFARHLASTYHTRREAGNEPMVLDENIQRLLLKQSPIQCHVCSFYCNNMTVMLEHMKTEDHVEKCSELSGPLICVRCKFKVYSNDALLQHLNSPEHVELIKSSGRPCIVKEVRCNVPCQICYKEFHSATQLEQHIREYHKPGDSEDPLKRPPKQRGIRYKMPCPFCNKEWTTTFALNLHIKRRHTKERPFPCKPCGIAFTDAASLRSHEATRKHINQQVVIGLMTSEEAIEAAKTPRKIKMEKESGAVSQLRNVCQECDFSTNYYGEMKTHYQAEHPEKILYCKPCSFETFLEKQFERHERTSTHVKRIAAFKEDDEEGDFQCETCLARCPSKEKLDIHQLIHTTIMTEKQLREANDGDPLVGVHPRFHEFWRTSCLSKNEKITCVECQQVVVGQNMIGHLRKHSGSYPFLCPKCSHRFASASSLRRHMQTIHLNIKMHKCSLCEEKFNRRTYLLSHLLRVHKDTADVDCPHVCKVCDKRFPLKHMLTAHLPMHSDERPHQCDFEGCDSKYKTKYELEMHRRKHTGERPFVCEFCGYSATGRQKLTRHLRTHTQERNYSCQYCEYKAQNSTHLHRHMRIHIGSKPYKCPYCTHTCNTIENIRKHILHTKRHQGLPCYPCQLCDFGTNFIKDFAQHLIEEHDKKIDPKEILSVVAGVFNKEEDTKDIPEGSCAIPLKEKILHVSPVKTTTVSGELKRKREKSAQKVLQDGSALVIQLNKRQKLENCPQIMVDYVPETSQNAAQSQSNISQETECTVQTIHVGKDTAETVTYQQPQVIQFDEQMIPVSSAIEMVHYTPQTGDTQAQIYEQGTQQYQMVYTTEAPQQQMDMIPGVAVSGTESIVIAQEREETIDSIKQAMEGIQGGGDDEQDHELEAIEVDESTLLRLGGEGGKMVQWVREDGSVILCDNAQQLYDKFQMVVYDGNTTVVEGGEGDRQGDVGEVVAERVVGVEGEMFMENAEAVCKLEPPAE